MKPEEDQNQLQAENQALREQLALRDSQLAQRDELIAQLLQRVQALEERLGKESHHSHLPPSSDRFVRKQKSLRKPGGKKPGGQQGHPGQRLRLSSEPDEVIVQTVEHCQNCQADLHGVIGRSCEHRQGVDIP